MERDSPGANAEKFREFTQKTKELKHETTWVFPKIEVPQNGWLIMENPIRMDDLGVPLFLETFRCRQLTLYFLFYYIYIYNIDMSGGFYQ